MGYEITFQDGSKANWFQKLILAPVVIPITAIAFCAAKNAEKVMQESTPTLSVKQKHLAMGNYILDGHTPVEESDIIKWARWYETADRSGGPHWDCEYSLPRNRP